MKISYQNLCYITILDLMNIDKPKEMTGETLLEKE